MNMGPFNSPCAACCSLNAAFRYCMLECLPNGQGGFEGTTAIDRPEFPHLHRKCERCGYEWLERCLGIPAYEEGKALIEVGGAT